MKTTIDNELRIYQVVTKSGKQVFCNITELNAVVSELKCREGYFKIYHFWNYKPRMVTKKDLKTFFEGSELKQEFFY